MVDGPLATVRATMEISGDGCRMLEFLYADFAVSMPGIAYTPCGPCIGARRLFSGAATSCLQSQRFKFPFVRSCQESGKVVLLCNGPC